MNVVRRLNLNDDEIVIYKAYGETRFLKMNETVKSSLNFILLSAVAKVVLFLSSVGVAIGAAVHTVIDPSHFAKPFPFALPYVVIWVALTVVIVCNLAMIEDEEGLFNKVDGPFALLFNKNARFIEFVKGFLLGNIVKSFSYLNGTSDYTYEQFYSLLESYLKSASDEELLKMIEHCLKMDELSESMQNMKEVLNQNGGLQDLRVELNKKLQSEKDEFKKLKEQANVFFKTMLNHQKATKDNEISEKMIKMLAA